MNPQTPNIINCFHCRHFVTTWEPKHPKACALFGIKTSQMPSAVVFTSTGEPCNGFELKEK
jgi:hypothetical protein